MRHFTVTGIATACRIALHAFRDQRGLAHETGAEAPALHAIARTTAVEVDLVVAELLADARRLRELARIAAAELQRHGMLAASNASSRVALPAHDRAAQ